MHTRQLFFFEGTRQLSKARSVWQRTYSLLGILLSVMTCPEGAGSAPMAGYARSPVNCNTPDVTFPICTPTLAVSGVKLYIFSRVRVLVSVCCYHCHASHIMSSYALHSHTCSSHTFEHFPRCPFCIPALRSPPVVISTFLSCVGIKHFRIGPRLVMRPWFTTGRPPVKFRTI